jgi:HAD superfamily hydrolase (TIGR01549 family)
MFAVLFDLEGTLVLSVENDEKAIVEFRIKTKEKLLELGIPLTELENVVKSTLMRNKALEYVEKHFTEQEARRFHLEMNKFLKVFELSWARGSTIFPDTVPALHRLRELGYRMGVFTNTSKEAANLELSMHKIEDYFDVVITREDVKKLKPDPEGIYIALKKLNAVNFVFVGDLIHDFRATKKAKGISSIVDRNPQEPLEFDADYIVDTLLDIPSLIQQLAS